MEAERTGKEIGTRGDPLFSVQVVERSAAPAEVVYDLLADLRTHAEWGGRRQKSKRFRLTSIDAPAGPAEVGTEFASSGLDPTGTFTDSSVVTEATRPSALEFVTEARLRPKRGDVLEWTNVHRYDIEPSAEGGCRIAYTQRVMRLSRRPWWAKGWAKGFAQKMSASYTRGGLRALARMAEERAGSSPA